MNFHIGITIMVTEQYNFNLMILTNGTVMSTWEAGKGTLLVNRPPSQIREAPNNVSPHLLFTVRAAVPVLWPRCSSQELRLVQHLPAHAHTNGRIHVAYETSHRGDNPKMIHCEILFPPHTHEIKAAEDSPIRSLQLIVSSPISHMSCNHPSLQN